jgi:hypothetical protein
MDHPVVYGQFDDADSDNFEQNDANLCPVGNSDSSVEEDMNDWDWEDEVSGEWCRHRWTNVIDKLDSHIQYIDETVSVILRFYEEVQCSQTTGVTAES